MVDEETAGLEDSQCASDCVALDSRGRWHHFADDPVVQLSGPIFLIVSQDEGQGNFKHRLGFGHNCYS